MIPGAWRDSSLLGERDVVIFRGRMEVGADLGPGARNWLSDAERGRSEGFRFDVDRARHDLRVAFRRLVLGRLLGRDPASLHFEVGPHGKPRLAPSQAPGLHFSASQSAGEIRLAVARREVGVDIQDQRPLDDLDGMADRIMTPAERDAFSALTGGERIRAFYRLWCRKEAALKALGEGFARDPATIRVGLQPAPLAEVLKPDDPVVGPFGALADLPAPGGFSAAVCAAGTGWGWIENDRFSVSELL